MDEAQIPSTLQINSIIPPKFNLPDFVKRQKLITKVIAIIIVATVIGTGIALATRIWDPLWNPLRPSPEKVISEAFKNIKKVKSLRTRIKVEIKNIDSDGNQLNYSLLELNDESDINDLENIKSKGRYDMVIGLSGLGISLSGDYIKKDGVGFLKLSKIPDLSFLIGLDSTSLIGQWIKTNKRENSSSFSISKRIINLLKDKNIFLVKNELSDEKINNKKTYHYIVILNKEIIRELIKEFSSDVSDVTDQIPLIAKVINQQLEELLDELKNLEIGVWIGKRDNLLYKIRIYKENIQNSRGKDIINFEVNFSDFNKSIEIETPKNYKSIEEIIKTINLPFLRSSIISQ